MLKESKTQRVLSLPTFTQSCTTVQQKQQQQNYNNENIWDARELKINHLMETLTVLTNPWYKKNKQNKNKKLCLKHAAGKFFLKVTIKSFQIND